MIDSFGALHMGCMVFWDVESLDTKYKSLDTKYKRASLWCLDIVCRELARVDVTLANGSGCFQLVFPDAVHLHRVYVHLHRVYVVVTKPGMQQLAA